MGSIRGLFFVSFLMVFIVFSFGQVENYKGKIIRGINFEGLKNKKELDFVDILKPYIGIAYSNEIFDKLQIDLYSLDYFFGLIKPMFKIDGEDLFITFIVKEKSLVNSVVFSDSSRVFWNSELVEKVNIKVNEPLNLARVNKGLEKLEDMYKDMGYLDVSANFEIKEEKNLVDIIFNIVAGPKYVIKGIDFEGNLSFKSSTLRKSLASRVVSLFSDGKYLKSNIDKDKRQLESFYKNNGYIDIKIINSTVDIKDSLKDSQKLEKEVFLKYFISEGNVFKFGKLEIFGNLVFSLEELKSFITFKEGDIFNNSKFEQDFTKIKESYFKEGYIFTEVIPSQKIRGEFVDFLIKILEKDKAHIESITVSKNKNTASHVILREIPLQEGDVFSLDKFKMGMVNLQQLGYFSNVVPDIVPSNTEGLMRINLNIEERATSNFGFGMNFGGSSNSSFPFSVFGQWELSNFLGEGYYFAARLNLSFLEQSLSLTFRDNWFFQKRWTVGGFIDFSHSVNTAYQDINGPIFSGKKEVPDPFTSWEEYRDAKSFSDFNAMNYSLLKLSFGGFTGYTFSNYLGKQTLLGTLQTALKYVFYDNEVNRPSNYYLRDNYKTFRFENSLSLSAAWDTRNSTSLSNNGFLLKQQFDFFGGFLFGQSHFIKSATTFERYFSLLGYEDVFTPYFDIILTLRSVYSNILPPLGNGFEIEIQPHHHIFLSENFMQARGWGILKNIYSSFVNTVQISIPLLKNILVWDVFFIDFASYSLEGQENSLFRPFSSFAFSWGTGIRSLLPQLPLSFVIAYPFYFDNDKVNSYYKYFSGFKFFLGIEMRY
ncbi:outer membrane protein assembly factor BamA [Borreliella yangtzensis]|uniref:Outer membrane protein assembly factor BamA n=1 Tax=Borreliella yangtzensis TaxID=683292 RepID=A0ABR6PDK4_9SPIR|nr:outer membrane protein assembly factor BamA [Borreliella yangtzensis]MBB6042776.1 outer membrane protein insertion porin family [Borreliella yangtzensis]WKC73732.1 outer membrane protein assembly factor BamA [Borreliella yangtzensis]WKC74648.1 outer membrane protein assembly factor BamA [Borreliella yangtzensis]